MRILFLTGMMAAMAGLGGSEAQAQIRASERGRVWQTVNGTVISVDYSRPRLRGRSGILGGQARVGEVWTPGANMATVLEVSDDVRINDHPVPKGRYSVWMAIRPGDWALLLDTTATRFHTQKPGETEVAIRIPVTPRRGTATEVLTWSFPDIESKGAILQFSWDTVTVSLAVQAGKAISTAVPAEAARPLTGRYLMRWMGPPRPGINPATNPGVPINVEVTYRDGSLWARSTPDPIPGHNTMVLLHLRDDWYTVALWEDGAIFDVMEGVVMEFALASGKATGFEIRAGNDYLLGRAQRAD